ncbi:ATP-binding protein [Devosia sp.]|uniref:sensor histidine kinase n=1 Tax=Devosia sp. TaxID=1871048 RepID=UPI001AFDA631|nr:ATP-binding protein [Devosia sp.]MBO9590893.1 PAS domain S-box protein [Devosia sp.]
MSAPGSHRREVVAVGIAVLAFVVLLAFSLARLVQIERTTHSSSGEGIIWALSQAQFEIHRLILATTPTHASSPDDIALRFDILMSRLELLQSGPMAVQLADAGRTSVISRARTALSQLEPLILASGTDVTRYSARLSRTMGQYLEPLGTIANDLMIANRIADGERRNSYNASIIQVIVSILGIMITGGFLVLRLVRSLALVAATEAQIRQEKTFLSRIMEASGEGIAAFDNQMLCTHWSSRMTQLLALPAEERLGRPLPTDPIFEHDVLERVLAGDEVYLAPRLGDGGTYLERMAYPIRLNGAVNGGIAIVRDVTERHDAQRERQLREIYRDFVTMVSHQFRTPLAVIDSTVHRMMRRGSLMDGAELSNRAMTIRNAVSGLSRLMDSTLTAERIDAGEMELNRRETDLSSLLGDIRTRLLELMPERRIILTLAEMLPIDCDVMLLDQALGNLVGNALKYSPSDKAVEISTGEEAGLIVIRVTDHGVGIPEAEQRRIFERFFRASTATTVQGSGIGLYTARQIARLHGGDITVVSDLTTGTTFSLSLPRPRFQDQ